VPFITEAVRALTLYLSHVPKDVYIASKQACIEADTIYIEANTIYIASDTIRIEVKTIYFEAM
jgi:hypothetical protein